MPTDIGWLAAAACRLFSLGNQLPCLDLVDAFNSCNCRECPATSCTKKKGANRESDPWHFAFVRAEDLNVRMEESAVRSHSTFLSPVHSHRPITPLAWCIVAVVLGDLRGQE